MTHTVRDHDGMKVLVVHDMERRFDDDGKLVSSKAMNDLEIVHAQEIARYYGIPLRTIGRGDNEIPGTWAMVFSNEIGQRVPYNTEETRPGDRNVRVWKVIKDAAGNPMDTEEKVVRAKVHYDGNKPTGFPLVDELDDGMYVRLEDLLTYAAAQGWTKGGGRPGVVAPAAIRSTEDKLDKLVELIQGLAQIVAHQVVAAPPSKK